MGGGQVETSRPTLSGTIDVVGEVPQTRVIKPPIEQHPTHTSVYSLRPKSSKTRRISDVASPSADGSGTRRHHWPMGEARHTQNTHTHTHTWKDKSKSEG